MRIVFSLVSMVAFFCMEAQPQSVGDFSPRQLNNVWEYAVHRRFTPFDWGSNLYDTMSTESLCVSMRMLRYETSGSDTVLIFHVVASGVSTRQTLGGSPLLATISDTFTEFVSFSNNGYGIVEDSLYDSLQSRGSHPSYYFIPLRKSHLVSVDSIEKAKVGSDSVYMYVERLVGYWQRYYVQDIGLAYDTADFEAPGAPFGQISYTRRLLSFNGRSFGSWPSSAARSTDSNGRLPHFRYTTARERTVWSHGRRMLGSMFLLDGTRVSGQSRAGSCVTVIRRVEQ
jgi:hypothetical protein